MPLRDLNQVIKHCLAEQGIKECHLCGALIINEQVHAEWHKRNSLIDFCPNCGFTRERGF